AQPPARRATTVGRGAKPPSQGLPGDYLISGEDAIEQGVVREIARDLQDRDTTGRRDGGRAWQADQRHVVAGAALLVEDARQQLDVVALEQVEDAGHEKTRKRRPCRTRLAICSREISITGCLASFQSASAGTALRSTWNGMPSRLRFSRNRAMSSPSTRSSVSASSRWTAGPRSTNVTAFSPATTPTPMRMASNARCETRGSHAITTRTGWSSAIQAGRSVQRDEAIGAVDQVRQHHETAVGDPVAIAQRQPALLAAVRAPQDPGAAIGQAPDARIVERPDAVVDQIEIQLRAPRERCIGQSEGGLEIAMLGTGREQQREF